MIMIRWPTSFFRFFFSEWRKRQIEPQNLIYTISKRHFPFPSWKSQFCSSFLIVQVQGWGFSSSKFQWKGLEKDKRGQCPPVGQFYILLFDSFPFLYWNTYITCFTPSVHLRGRVSNWKLFFYYIILQHQNPNNNQQAIQTSFRLKEELKEKSSGNFRPWTFWDGEQDKKKVKFVLKNKFIGGDYKLVSVWTDSSACGCVGWKQEIETIFFEFYFYKNEFLN